MNSPLSSPYVFTREEFIRYNGRDTHIRFNSNKTMVAVKDVIQMVSGQGRIGAADIWMHCKEFYKENIASFRPYNSDVDVDFANEKIVLDIVLDILEDPNSAHKLPKVDIDEVRSALGMIAPEVEY